LILTYVFKVIIPKPSKDFNHCSLFIKKFLRNKANTANVLLRPRFVRILAGAFWNMRKQKHKERTLFYTTQIALGTNKSRIWTFFQAILRSYDYAVFCDQ